MNCIEFRKSSEKNMRKWKIVALGIFCLFSLKWSIEWWEHRKYLLEDELIEQSRIETPDTESFDEQTYEKWTNKECATKYVNIAFLKTHKTASSTITSILNRFADLNDLEMAIPNGDTRFNWPSPFTLQALDRSRLKDRRANVLCNHSVLNRKELFKAMKPGFRLITILRDPVEQIYSLFHYENFTRIYEIPAGVDPVEVFFANSSVYYRQFKSRQSHAIFMLESLLRNGMTYDLNYQRFQKRLVKNTHQDFVEYLDQAFHLVLITEKFDESLLLLKQLMCWDYMDLVYKKKLVNLHNQKKRRKKQLKRKIRNWSKLDVIIYNHFKTKLENILALQDQGKFEEQLILFRTLNHLVSTYCANMTEENFDEVTDLLREIREEPPAEFLNKPLCFCNKLERSEHGYLKYFRTKFPSYHFLEYLKNHKKVEDGC